MFQIRLLSYKIRMKFIYILWVFPIYKINIETINIHFFKNNCLLETEIMGFPP